MRKNKKCQNRVTSIQYVHDSEAAKEWMGLFMELTKRQFIDCVTKDRHS